MTKTMSGDELFVLIRAYGDAEWRFGRAAGRESRALIVRTESEVVELLRTLRDLLLPSYRTEDTPAKCFVDGIDLTG
jgi:hypothetical protein